MSWDRLTKEVVVGALVRCRYTGPGSICVTTVKSDRGSAGHGPREPGPVELRVGRIFILTCILVVEQHDTPGFLWADPRLAQYCSLCPSENPACPCVSTCQGWRGVGTGAVAPCGDHLDLSAFACRVPV